MKFSNNTLKVHITANSETEREAWALHFACLFGGCNRVVSAGLWEGVAEPDIQIETVVFDPDYCGFVAKTLKELEIYQCDANQYAVLVEGFVLGQRWAALIENPEDYSLSLSRVCTLVQEGLYAADNAHWDYQASKQL